MIKKLVIIMAIVAAVLLGIYVFNSTVNTSDPIEGESTLKIGVLTNVTGMSVLSEGEFQGVEADFAKALMAQMFGDENYGQLVGVSIQSATHSLSAGEVDMSIATLVEEEGFLESESYYTDKLIALYNTTTIDSVQSLSEKNIGVIMNSYEQRRIVELLEDEDIVANIKEYASYEDCYFDLDSGEIDTIITLKAYNATSYNTFEIEDAEFRVFVGEEDKELLERVNQAIEELKNSGSLSEIVGI